MNVIQARTGFGLRAGRASAGGASAPVLGRRRSCLSDAASRRPKAETEELFVRALGGGSLGLGMQWLDQLPFADNRVVQIGFLAACGIAALIVLAIFYRLVFAHRLRVPGGRTRQPRLGLVDAFSLDGQRQLVLVRRDNVEHLVMIGGPNDVLVESQINRAMTPARENNQASPLLAPSASGAPNRDAAGRCAGRRRSAAVEGRRPGRRAPAPRQRRSGARLGSRSASAARPPPPAAPKPATPAPASAAARRPRPPGAGPLGAVPNRSNLSRRRARLRAPPPAAQSAEPARPEPASLPPPRPAPARPAMPPPIVPASGSANRATVTRLTEKVPPRSSPIPGNPPAASAAAPSPPRSETAEPAAAAAAADAAARRPPAATVRAAASAASAPGATRGEDAAVRGRAEIRRSPPARRKAERRFKRQAADEGRRSVRRPRFARSGNGAPARPRKAELAAAGWAS